MKLNAAFKKPEDDVKGTSHLLGYDGIQYERIFHE